MSSSSPAAAPARKFPHPKPSPPPPTMPPPALPEEILEEVFLRLPRDEPEHLVRASLASKLWLGLLSGARFRGRYIDFHGAPPMLGFLCSWRSSSGHQEVEDNVPRFFPTTKFRGRIPDDDWGDWDYAAWDCRHGRVLLGDASYQPMPLVVWDPMTGCRKEMNSPDYEDSCGVAVLCAVSGCDHRACHAGPFQVVFVGLDMTDDECVAHAWVSLPVTADWSKPCSGSHFDKWSEPSCGLHLELDAFVAEPSVLVEEALYFMLEYDDGHRVGILKYDLRSHCLSLIDTPLVGLVITDTAILMAMKDGSLGFAHVDKLTLHLWSRQKGSDGVVSWTRRTVIDLNNLLPIQNPNSRLRVIGSVEGSDIIFVTMGLNIYEFNLKTLRWKKLQKREKLCSLIPYMSFYSPQETVRPSDVTY